MDLDNFYFIIYSVICKKAISFIIFNLKFCGVSHPKSNIINISSFYDIGEFSGSVC